MMNDELVKIVQRIISESVRLKNTFTNETNANVEFCDIFSSDDSEFEVFTKMISQMGNVVFPGSTGSIYLLHKPISSIAGGLYYLKVRKPDVNLHLRGDADFNTDYPSLKQKYNNQPHFELIVRDKFEMLRLSDPNFDVMSCFSSIPVRNWI